jgi:hypothetical protein
MSVTIDSRFATAEDTANALGVSARELKALRKLVDESLKTRGANGTARARRRKTRLARKAKTAR